MTTSEQFAEWTILRTIRVQAVATFILRDTFKRLEALEADLLSALIRADVTGEATATDRRAALREFSRMVDERITEVYREILSRTESDFQALADTEDEAQRTMLGAFGTVREKSPLDATKVLILGLTLKDWIGRQAGDLEFRVNQAVREGVDNGEDGSRLQNRITGSTTEKDGIIISRPTDSSRRNAESIVRTGVTVVQSEVMSELGERLPKSIRMGWQQISVLDSKTTQVCRAYAFKIWDRDYRPIGHDLPFNGGVPRHIYCRSRVVPYLFDDGPTKELTFKQWVHSLKPEDQKQIFGEERLRLWRDGKFTDQDLIRQQSRAIDPRELD